MPATSQYGTPDLLYYSHLGAEGIVILKDGSLLRTYRLHGPDLKSASIEELLSVKFHGNQALTRLDDGWMVQVDLVRFPSAEYLGGGEFPDATTRTIEHERELHYRAEGAHFDTAIYLTITYRPPSKQERRVMRLFVAEDAPDDQQNLAHFQTTTDALAHDLSAHLELTPLNSGQLLSFIESALIGEQVTIRPPRQFNYLDLFLGRHALVNTGAWPTIGGRAIRVVIPTGFPLESHAEVTDFLCELPFPYRYSIRAVLLGTQAANAVIGTARKHWHQKILRARDFLVQTTGAEANPAYRNEQAADMAEDANEAVREAQSNLVRYLYLTMGVVLIGADEKDVAAKAEEVRKLFSHYGFLAHIETWNTLDAWRSFTPGDGFSNVRRPIVSSQNLSDFIPMTTTWTGTDYNACPMYPPRTPPLFHATGEGLTPFRFHAHVSDVGHGLVMGPIGAGKSTFLGLLMAQAFRVPGMQVFCFDKGYSAFVLTKACGGQHWDLGNDNITAAPLTNLHQETEQDWAHGYVCALLELALKRQLVPEEDEAVWRAIKLSAKAQREHRTFTNLRGNLQNTELKQALSRYAGQGPMARYLDAKEDALLDARFVTFELETLQNSQALVPVLLYLFHRIEQRLDGRPTLVVIDEAWVALTKSFFGAKVEEWLRDWRKKNAAVWLATQSLDDLRQSEYRSVVLESCPSKIYLPNPEALTPNLTDIYRDFGLSDRRIEIIAEAIPKRHYYLVSPLGRRLFNLALDQATLAFIGAGSKNDLLRARHMIAEYGDRWPAEWLRERGLGEWADYWLATAGTEAASDSLLRGVGASPYANGKVHANA